MTLAALDLLRRCTVPPVTKSFKCPLQALERLSHRGGVDADGASGDGAGLLTSLPADFFRARAADEQLYLGELFGVGMLFVPPTRVADARAAIEESIGRGKLKLSGWRRVPVNPNSLGQRAFESMPEIWQFFIEPTSPKTDPISAAKFERAFGFCARARNHCCPSAATSAHFPRARLCTKVC